LNSWPNASTEGGAALALVTATRRGLVFVLYSEMLLLAGAIGFLLFPGYPAMLVWGVLGSAALGALGGLSLWSGRREFGVAQQRSVRRVWGYGSLLMVSLVFAFFQVTSVFPDSRHVSDLRGPWFFLGLALVADVLAIRWLLSPYLVAAERRWIHTVVGVGLLGLAAYAWIGWTVLEDLLVRSSRVQVLPMEAPSYARDFVLRIVRPWTVALVALRIGFLPGLWQSITNVAEAEREAEAKVEQAPLLPPP
jgi:hypothetical protein